MVAQLALARDTRVIARVADASYQRRDALLFFVEADGGFFGGEVDARLDAFKLVEVLLDARGAGRAGHAFEVELDRLHQAGLIQCRSSIGLPSGSRISARA